MICSKSEATVGAAQIKNSLTSESTYSVTNTNKDKISKDIGILHEINDQMDIIKPITKWQARVLKAKKIPNVVKKSFIKLRTGRPRPIEIEIPPETLSEISNFPNYKQTKIPLFTINKKSLKK